MTATPPTIRRATLADAAMLADVGARWFEDTFGRWNDPADMRVYLESAFGVPQQTAQLEDPERVVLVAEREGETVAYASLRRTPMGGQPAGIPDAPAVEVERFYTAPGLQGSGLAQRLMATVIETGRELGGELLWLGVWERNGRAIRFYAKCGFQEAGAQEFVLGTDRQRDLLLVLPLARAR